MAISRFLLCLYAGLTLMNSSVVNAFDHQHPSFTQVLADVVQLSANKKQTRVDYAQLFNQPAMLNGYLADLSAVKKCEYETWTENQKLSFLINAYNGFTLQLITQNYDKFKTGKAESIKDLGSFFSSPWKKSFFTLLDKKRSLDNVEHDMIRVWFDRPRIHAALVCAAVSCPPLLNQAFVADNLDAQLDEQMRVFLSDDKNNSTNLSKNRLTLSSIFKWYGSDFEKGQQGFNNLQDLIKTYETDIADNPEQLAWLQKQSFDIRYLNYDWRLNDISTF
jgi:hypothetical protein